MSLLQRGRNTFEQRPTRAVDCRYMYQPLQPQISDGPFSVVSMPILQTKNIKNSSSGIFEICTAYIFSYLLELLQNQHYKFVRMFANSLADKRSGLKVDSSYVDELLQSSAAEASFATDSVPHSCRDPGSCSENAPSKSCMVWAR